jgi:O-antigen ligase
LSVLRADHSIRERWRTVDPWPILALPVALAASWLFTTRPRLIELLALLVLALPLLMSSKVRVVFLLVGTVTVFGPPELTLPKLLFLFGSGVALAGAFLRSRSLVRTPPYEAVRPLLLGSAGMLVVVVLSFPVAHANGVAPTDWLRDVAPYVLVAWAPLFAFDAHLTFGARGLRRLVILMGLAGSASFMTRWLVNREITTIIPGGIGLGTLLLGGALFSLGMAVALNGTRGRFRWLLLAAFVLAMLASTATRTAVVFLAAPIAIMLGSRQHLARRSLRLLAVLPLAAALVTAGTYSLLKVFQADEDVVAARFRLLLESGSADDQSYVARRSQAEAAWALFRSAPLYGVGPGHVIPWTDARGIEARNPIVDSPLGLLADYGLMGLTAVTFFAVSFVRVVRRLRRTVGERTTAQLALMGFGAIVLAHAALQVPFEDKGLAAALLLLFAVALHEASDRARLAQPA